MKIDISDLKKIFLENKVSFSTDLQNNDYINSIASIEKANSNSLIFLFNKKYSKFITETKAKCCVTKKEYLNLLPKNLRFIIVDDPYFVFALLSNIFSSNFFIISLLL